MFHTGELATLPEYLLVDNGTSIKSDQRPIWCYGLPEAL